MSSQTIENERVAYTKQFLELMESIGVEIPKQFLYTKADDDYNDNC